MARIGTWKLLAAVTMMGAALMMANSAHAGDGHCTSAVASEVYGYDNVTDIDVSEGGQVGTFQDGDWNEIDARVEGCSRVVIGQTGDDGDVWTDVEGRENDVGVDTQNGAKVRARIRGVDVDAAIYANGGVTKVDAGGKHSNTVVHNSGGYASIKSHGAGNTISVNID